MRGNSRRGTRNQNDAKGQRAVEVGDPSPGSSKHEASEDPYNISDDTADEEPIPLKKDNRKTKTAKKSSGQSEEERLDRIIKESGMSGEEIALMTKDEKENLCEVLCASRIEQAKDAETSKKAATKKTEKVKPRTGTGKGKAKKHEESKEPSIRSYMETSQSTERKRQGLRNHKPDKAHSSSGKSTPSLPEDEDEEEEEEQPEQTVKSKPVKHGSGDDKFQAVMERVIKRQQVEENESDCEESSLFQRLSTWRTKPAKQPTAAGDALRKAERKSPAVKDEGHWEIGDGAAKASPGCGERAAKASPGFRDRTAKASPGFRDRTAKVSPGFRDRAAKASPGFRDRSPEPNPAFENPALSASPVFRTTTTTASPYFAPTKSKNSPRDNSLDAPASPKKSKLSSHTMEGCDELTVDTNDVTDDDATQDVGSLQLSMTQDDVPLRDRLETNRQNSALGLSDTMGRVTRAKRGVKRALRPDADEPEPSTSAATGEPQFKRPATSLAKDDVPYLDETWSAGHSAETPSATSPPARKLVNKMRLRRRLYDRLPPYAPSGVAPETHARALVHDWERYRVTLRESQTCLASRVEWSSAPIVVGRHAPHTLSMHRRGQASHVKDENDDADDDADVDEWESISKKKVKLDIRPGKKIAEIFSRTRSGKSHARNNSAFAPDTQLDDDSGDDFVPDLGSSVSRRNRPRRMRSKGSDESEECTIPETQRSPSGRDWLAGETLDQEETQAYESTLNVPAEVPNSQGSKGEQNSQDDGKAGGSSADDGGFDGEQCVTVIKVQRSPLQHLNQKEESAKRRLAFLRRRSSRNSQTTPDMENDTQRDSSGRDSQTPDRKADESQGRDDVQQEQCSGPALFQSVSDFECDNDDADKREKKRKTPLILHQPRVQKARRGRRQPIISKGETTRRGESILERSSRSAPAQEEVETMEFVLERSDVAAKTVHGMEMQGRGSRRKFPSSPSRTLRKPSKNGTPGVCSDALGSSAGHVEAGSDESGSTTADDDGGAGSSRQSPAAVMQDEPGEDEEEVVIISLSPKQPQKQQQQQQQQQQEEEHDDDEVEDVKPAGVDAGAGAVLDEGTPRRRGRARVAALGRGFTLAPQTEVLLAAEETAEAVAEDAANAVECPMCFDKFSPSQIAAHADRCDGLRKPGGRTENHPSPVAVAIIVQAANNIRRRSGLRLHGVPPTDPVDDDEGDVAQAGPSARLTTPPSSRTVLARKPIHPPLGRLKKDDDSHPGTEQLKSDRTAGEEVELLSSEDEWKLPPKDASSDDSVSDASASGGQDSTTDDEEVDVGDSEKQRPRKRKRKQSKGEHQTLAKGLGRGKGKAKKDEPPAQRNKIDAYLETQQCFMCSRAVPSDQFEAHVMQCVDQDEVVTTMAKLEAEEKETVRRAQSTRQTARRRMQDDEGEGVGEIVGVGARQPRTHCAEVGKLLGGTDRRLSEKADNLASGSRHFCVEKTIKVPAIVDQPHSDIDRHDDATGSDSCSDQSDSGSEPWTDSYDSDVLINENAVVKDSVRPRVADRSDQASAGTSKPQARGNLKLQAPTCSPGTGESPRPRENDADHSPIRTFQRISEQADSDLDYRNQFRRTDLEAVRQKRETKRKRKASSGAHGGKRRKKRRRKTKARKPAGDSRSKSRKETAPLWIK